MFSSLGLLAAMEENLNGKSFIQLDESSIVHDSDRSRRVTQSSLMFKNAQEQSMLRYIV